MSDIMPAIPRHVFDEFAEVVGIIETMTAEIADARRMGWYQEVERRTEARDDWFENLVNCSSGLLSAIVSTAQKLSDEQSL